MGGNARQGSSTAQPKPIDRTGPRFLYFPHQMMHYQKSLPGNKEGRHGSILELSHRRQSERRIHLQEQLLFCLQTSSRQAVRCGVHVLCKLHTAILEAAPAGSSQPPRTRNTKPTRESRRGHLAPALPAPVCSNCSPGRGSRRSVPEHLETVFAKLSSLWEKRSRQQIIFVGAGTSSGGKYCSDDVPVGKEPAEIAKVAVASIFQKSKMFSRSPSRLDRIVPWLNPFLG